MKFLKRIGLYGVSGTGKTTILKAVVAATSEVVWLQGSDMVLQAANMSLPEFKCLSDRQKYHFREQAILNAVQIQHEQNKHVIIDAHLAFLSDNGGFENAMTRQDAEFYTDYIYLNLPATIIHRRLLNDTARPRSRSVEESRNCASA
ncbi:MAG: AAA family ATPase [Hormoscilla sp. SP5CHS1]|nr:AAA family ATPase [Hormoscilla sp. SP12CHS1]MBC6454470.1 AAA family ATPase [Hormoscilla sp. SP5CHS1]